MEGFIYLGIALVVIGIIIWMKIRGRKKPIKGNGLILLAPIAWLIVAISLSVSQLLHIPGKPFHLPAYWELLLAGMLGVLFGVIMLKQTAYERREDGHIYPKPNKNFKFILIGIVAIRLTLSEYFKNIDTIEFTLLTLFMALLYIGIWRVGSYLKFMNVKSQ